MTFTQLNTCDETTLCDRQKHSAEDKGDSYIGDLSFTDYYRIIGERFPFMLQLIDAGRVTGPALHRRIKEMNEMSWEFEGQNEGGRGNAYNLAQRNPKNRVIGTLSLLKCFSDDFEKIPGPDKIILDALAGDGTITRLLRTEKLHAPTIISADLSSFMIQSCMEQKFPCIRQSATYGLLKDSVLDGVLIAYGSHHLDGSSRKQAAAEAYRMVRYGGRFVLHDFEEGTAMAKWFDQVVHPFSRTGHPHKHFTRDEMYELLQQAGFKNICVFSMADPFVLEGATPGESRAAALMHVYRMYDLINIAPKLTEALHKLEALIDEFLGGINIERKNSVWTATIQREALVAVGTKMI